jgi:beta-phosphoglucomutase-like phosphatase (HAD superfamily)
LCSFEEILQDTLAKLEAQRLEDPESVPENAEGIVKSVLKQEMDTEIERMREELSLERLKAYETDQRQSVDKKDISGPIDSELQRLIDESEQEYSQQEASRLQLEEFLKYEAEAFSQAASNIQTDATAAPPGEDLDQWAMERLEEMAKRRQDVDGAENVLDILDEVTQDLRMRMEKERAKKGSVKTETLKEWQMYRAIATRLGKQRDAMVEERSDAEDKSDNEEIVRRLESWKEYISKEQRLRDEGGLSKTSKRNKNENTVVAKSDRASRAETRKKINKMSIEALESLMVNSDPARRAKLQSEIDFLKAELEGKDFLDFEEPEEDEVVAPVDVSDMFRTSSEEKTRPRTAERRRKERGIADSTVTEDSIDRIPPPDTDFFSQSSDSSGALTKPPPPNTPFFSESEEVEDVQIGITDDSKLGSLEEQKLNSLYRRAGARTQAEQDRIREGWEEYQRIEKEKRRLSGLDATNTEYSLSSNFTLADIMKDDGDIDADKILSAIGPRPKRGQTRNREISSVPLDKLSEDRKADRTLEKREVTSSLYRSVSAAGGGRFRDDPEAKARDQAQYEEFLQKEEQMRKSLDESVNAAANESQALNEDFDEEEYAEDVLSSLGPRPSPRRTSRVDPREYSDMGGVLSGETVDDEEDEDSSVTEHMYQETPDMPDWLKQENADARNPKKKRRTFLGDEVEDAFDDDQYDKNMRQLKEYELRRAGKEASLGIDITDILGRDIDDYRDYEFDESRYGNGGRRGWGVASFEDRKRNLIEYIELDLAEVNALMDHRDSVHSTGVSQYAKRINKPFEAFGAIFRLEGVFADLSGLHKKAWTRIVESEGLRQPTVEEISCASVVRPEVAVQEVFVWTDDFIEAGRIARLFKEIFSEIFDSWAEANDLVNVQENPSSTTGSMAIGEDLFQKPTPVATVSLPEDEGELFDLLFRAWTQVAFDCSKSVPSREQVQQAAMLPPDIAIPQVFRWSSNTREVDSLQQKFTSIVRRLRGNGSQVEETPNNPTTSGNSGNASSVTITEAMLMEAHFVAWAKVAEFFSFDSPTSDEVLGAFVLNNPLIAIRDGFGWTDDKDTLVQAVDMFSTELNKAIKGLTGSEPPPTLVASSFTSQAETSSPRSSASDSDTAMYEEVLEINKKAWKIAAANHGFKAPPDDFVKLSLGLDPDDVIARIFRWTWDGDQINAIAETFRGQMKKESEDFATKYQVQPDQAALQIKTQQNTSEENVSADELYEAAFNAWAATSEVHNLPSPTREQVLVAMSVGPEEAIWKAFNWATDSESSWWILETYKEKIQAERSRLKLDEIDIVQDEGTAAEDLPLVTVIPGAYEWIKSLREYEMQCGVVSHLSRDQVLALLKFTNLNELFEPDVIVSASNGYRSDSQQMLGAALRLERRPDHCVVFDSSPYASVAAHELDMRSVGLIGCFPRYELLSADTTASGFQELTAFNIRRLFGERIFDQPELDRQQAEPSQTKKVRTMYDWGDD